jgi:hypothetical protein
MPQTANGGPLNRHWTVVWPLGNDRPAALRDLTCRSIGTTVPIPSHDRFTISQEDQTITLTDYDFYLLDGRTYVATLKTEDECEELPNGNIFIRFVSRGDEEIQIVRQHRLMFSKCVRTVTVEVKDEPNV